MLASFRQRPETRHTERAATMPSTIGRITRPSQHHVTVTRYKTRRCVRHREPARPRDFFPTTRYVLDSRQQECLLSALAARCRCRLTHRYRWRRGRRNRRVFVEFAAIERHEIVSARGGQRSQLVFDVTSAFGRVRRRRHVRATFLQVSLQLRAPVLEPRDHLRVRQSQTERDLVPVGRREVLLVEEALLEFVDLLIREGRARFPSLLRRRILCEHVQLIGAGRI